MAIIGSDILYAQRLLTAGQVVAIPTETVYGLAGNAYDTAAISTIFSTKQRPSFDPLIVHVGSMAQAQSFTTPWPSTAMQLAQYFWPGPLTLVLEKNSRIPDIVTAGLPSVGVRMPQHSLALSLLRQLPFSLAAPSANPFGYISPTTPQHVQQQLGGNIPYILDGGSCVVGLESTIVGFERAKPVIYRLGSISVEAIEEAIGPVSILEPAADTAPQVPGMLTSHYAPTKPLRIGDLDALLAQYSPQEVGILAFDRLHPAIAPERQVVLSPSRSLREAAQRLFAAMRTLDALPVEVILATPVPDAGIGKAINDRLKRASH
ncbi:MAG: L-threonylcarbamoyladenylate synthase [Bacteroidota bacterium]